MATAGLWKPKSKKAAKKSTDDASKEKSTTSSGLKEEALGSDETGETQFPDTSQRSVTLPIAGETGADILQLEEEELPPSSGTGQHESTDEASRLSEVTEIKSVGADGSQIETQNVGESSTSVPKEQDGIHEHSATSDTSEISQDPRNVPATLEKATEENGSRDTGSTSEAASTSEGAEGGEAAGGKDGGSSIIDVPSDTEEGSDAPTPTEQLSTSINVKTKKVKFAVRGNLHFKVVILGAAGTGKTSIAKRYTQNKFEMFNLLTIGMHFHRKTIERDNRKIIIDLYDIGGQEENIVLCTPTFRMCNGACVVHDVKRPRSFKTATEWADELSTKVVGPDGETAPCIMLGNKCDLLGHNELPFDAPQDFLEQHYILKHFYTSAAKNIGIDEAFEFLIDQMIHRANEIGEDSDEERVSLVDEERVSLVSLESARLQKCQC